jgi:tetratricopeptide (TPR) repeat protein
VRFISLLLLVLVLTACSFSSRKADAPQVSGPVSIPASASVSASPVLPDGPPTPNPYLASVPSVNRAIQQQFAAAVAAMEQQQWDQAERILIDLAHSNPRLSGIPLNLGLIYRARGDHARAEQAFSQAITANPQNLDAYNQLAILKRQQGKFTEAEQLYQRALAIWPFHGPSHKNLAILYDLYLGRESDALAHYLAYQQLTGEDDKQLTSWIADLQRRVTAAGDQ